MIIGVDARPLSFGISGNSRYLFEVLKELQSTKDNHRYELVSNKPILPEYMSSLDPEKMKIVPTPSVPGPIWLQYYIPKLIQAQSWNAFWGTLQLLPVFSKKSIPYYVNYHDLNFVKARETMVFWNFLQHLFLSRKTLKLADKVFCLSENTRNDILEYEPSVQKNLTILYPGIQEIHNPKTIPDRCKVLHNRQFFLTIGTIEPRKNLRIAIEAFIRYKQKSNTFVHFVLLGRYGWGEEELYRQLKSKEFSDMGILFLENGQEEEIQWLYHNCLGFVFPSKMEGFGLPIIEAMAIGKHCLVSRIPVFQEFVSPSEDILADPYTPEEWVNGLDRLTKKPEKRKDFKTIRKEFSWKKTAKGIHEILFSSN
jgi:glycosyltransferase involved in cell wall biosynthesis